MIGPDVVALYQGGMLAKHIAKEYGLSYKVVLTRLKKAGVEVRPYVRPPSEASKRAIADYEAGASAKKAAGRHGLTASALHVALRVAGKKAKRQFTKVPFTDEEAKVIAEEYVRGGSIGVLGKRYGRESMSIVGLLKRLGVYIPNRLGVKPMKRFSQEEKAEMERLFKEGANTVQIGKAMGRHASTVGRYLNRTGVREWEPLTRKYGAEIIELYGEGHSPKQISARLGVPTHNVSHIVQRSGTAHARQYITHNEEFWFDWTPISAYWLGFLLADGCISDHAGRPNLLLSVAKIDEEHLRLFLSDIGSDAPIRSTKKTMRGKVFEQLAARTPLTDVEAERLADYGLVPRKTYTLDLSVLERLPEELVRDAVRGYADGDGCVWIPGDCARGHMALSIAANRVSSLFLAEWMRRTVGIECAAARGKQSRDLFSVYWNGSKAAIVCEFLYGECERYLPRKREKALRIVKEWEVPKKRPGPRLRNAAPACLTSG